MIKKLVSDALLSLVMDKNARETLDARQTIKKAAKQIEQATNGNGPAAARVKSKAGAPAASDLDGDSDETRQLIADSIAAAEREFLEQPKLSPERQKLIAEAMSVQRSKEHLLDNLSQEQREKLYVVALKSLKPDLDGKVRKRTQRYLGTPRKK